MAETPSGSRVCIWSLILIPGLITLAVTILRLVGELQHWPAPFFKSEAGGGGAIVGIAWLPFIFGPYFALKLADAGEGPKGRGKAIGFAVLGLVIAILAGLVGFAPTIKFPGKQVVGYVLVAASALPVLSAWPALGRTLIAYGFAARIPVAMVMFFALRGSWGTHYDAPPPGYPPDVAFWPKYFEIGLLPQLILWVAYTVVVGALLGSIVTAIARRGKAGSPATS